MKELEDRVRDPRGQVLAVRHRQFGSEPTFFVGGTVPGPWATIVQFELGYAVHSDDYDSVEGDFTVQVLFLKYGRDDETHMRTIDPVHTALECAEVYPVRSIRIHGDRRGRRLGGAGRPQR